MYFCSLPIEIIFAGINIGFLKTDIGSMKSPLFLCAQLLFVKLTSQGNI